MILTPEAVRKVRPIAENINDLARIETYLREAETLQLIDAIGASLYRWLDETDFSGAGPFIYSRPDGKEVLVTKEQYIIALEGGYYTSCNCEGYKRSAGLVPAIAYIAYSRFIMNNPVNATAFGVVHKLGEFSAQVNDNILVRTANEARKIGKAYLTNVIEYLNIIGLLGRSCCSKTYSSSQTTKLIRINTKKL